MLYFVFVLTKSGTPSPGVKTGEIAVGSRRASLPQNPRTGGGGVSTSGGLPKEYREMVVLENRSLFIWRLMSFQFCPSSELTTAGSQESVFRGPGCV